jgi:crotonobetainyl-CoA:carnitine CoA-transferase CaiB-like acyl-CoA transferase
VKILDGLKVLDLTTIVSGPYAASLLADLGADVIKVEPPSPGDSARVFETNEPRYTMGGLSPHIMTLARNKRGIVINLRSDRGKETFADLVRWADVVLDNYRPGVTERLRIDYASLCKIDERIITCSITGYGQTGPGRDRAALDACIQAYAGVMGITGDADGDPMRAGPLYSDASAGMAGALGILAAIVARDRTGLGQHIDISMLDVQISMLTYISTMQMMSGLPAARWGNEHALHVPYNAYPTEDGFLFVAAFLDHHWAALMGELARMTLPASVQADVDYLRQEPLLQRLNRLDARAPINAALASVLSTRPRDAWLSELTAAGIPVAPVNSVEDAVNDPHVHARDMIVDVPHPAGGTFKAPGNPIKMSAADPDSFGPPPLLGQDTTAVLAEVLGYDQAKIDGLVADGAVQTHQD